MSTDPALDVMADLLLAAVEADRVEETTELLSDLVGEAPVRAAYEVVFDRLSTAVGAAAGAEPTSGDDRRSLAARTPADVFDLARRLRTESSKERP